MKLITLNTHSLEETDYEKKFELSVEAILKEKPDVIALQEVNQPMDGAPVDEDELGQSGFTPCEYRGGEVGGGESVRPMERPVPVREDNHAYRLVKRLAAGGQPYFWTWVPAKIGYGKYDEGTALLCRLPISEAMWFYSTDTRDYGDWRSRAVLGIRVESCGVSRLFFSVHMGWWNDEREPFKRQWTQIEKQLSQYMTSQCWLMGDFNSPSDIAGEGYQLVRESGWLDTYDLAATKDSGITVGGAIDGWRDGRQARGMRIDYIWVNREIPVSRSMVVFNGSNYPVVSDHYGVMVECGDVKGEEEL